MSERVKDSRIAKWPKVIRKDGAVILSGKVLTPARLSILKECLVRPLRILWKIAIVVLVIEGLFYMGKSGGYLDPFGYFRAFIYLGMAGLPIIWQVEQFSGYQLTRILFGKRIWIEAFPDKIIVGRGLFKQSFNRDQLLTFRISSFTKAISPIYQNSQLFTLLTAENNPFRIAEIFNFKTGSQVINNANMILHIGEDDMDTDVDLDPTRNPSPL